DDARHRVALAFLPLGVPRGRHAGDLPAELRHPVADAAPVGLDLRLTGTTGADPTAAGDPAAGLPGQRLSPSAKPRKHVLHLRELDLRLALLAAGVLGEDVENQRSAVDDLDLDDVLELAQLARCQLTVADDGVGAGRDDDVPQLARLAGADVGRRVGTVA